MLMLQVAGLLFVIGKVGNWFTSLGLLYTCESFMSCLHIEQIRMAKLCPACFSSQPVCCSLRFVHMGKLEL